MRTLAAVAALSVVALSCARAPRDPATDGDRPPRRLGPPSEFPTPFSAIRTVMDLPDGRLVVSDPVENRISVIDFDQGTARHLGRLGAGPREYRRVGGLSRAPGGGVVVYDQQMIRLLPVSTNGTLSSDALGLPTGGLDDWSAHGPDQLAVDSLGYTYVYQRTSLVGQAAVLLRYWPGNRPDTIVRLLAEITKAVKANANGTGSYQNVLFSPEDAWAIAPDGTVAVVRAAPYRVEWYPRSGPVVSGPIITHRRLMVGGAEREFIASGAGGWQGTTTLTLVLVPLGGGEQRGPRPPPPAVPVDELLFAKVKPPVDLRGDVRPMTDERGWLWVQRSLEFEATTTVFDVFNRSGELVDRIELPARLRLVGFSPGWLYVSRRDTDDFEYLQRFPRGA